MNHIRPMRAEDRRSIPDLLQATGMFTGEEITVALELIDVYLADETQKDYHLLVMESATGATAGYVCYGPAPLTSGAYDLYWIAVSPEFQRQGIGQQLLAHTETEVLSRKGYLIIIETSSQEKYVPTQTFYLVNGYHLTARIKDFYRPGDDRLIFTKYLSNH